MKAMSKGSDFATSCNSVTWIAFTLTLKHSGSVKPSSESPSRRIASTWSGQMSIIVMS